MKNKIFKCTVRQMLHSILCIVALISLCTILQGCKIEEQNDKKVQDLDFTVLQEREVPQDILDMIEEKKKSTKDKNKSTKTVNVWKCHIY